MLRHRKLIHRKVKHPYKIHAWGCFSKHGFGELITFTGILNGKRMQQLYENELLPSAEYLFDRDWVFQEDNHPKHMNKVAKSGRKTMTSTG